MSILKRRDSVAEALADIDTVVHTETADRIADFAFVTWQSGTWLLKSFGETERMVLSKALQNLGLKLMTKGISPFGGGVEGALEDIKSYGRKSAVLGRIWARFQELKNGS